MPDDLLSYYQRELTYIRRLAAEFAETHPKIAGRLRLSADATDDPFVARLIESFAYLTARVRNKLDDDFPELTDGLLGILYPHYIAPIPSMAIVQMQSQPDLAAPFTLPAGTEIETEAVGGENCRFRLGYDTTLWPIELADAGMGGRPLVAPANPRATGAAGVLRLTLKTKVKDLTFSQLGLDRLRFFLRGQPQQIHPLYEMIFNNVVSVAIASGPSDPSPVILPPSAIEPVGFGVNEGILPYPARSFIGYRLLTEYFSFPEKFLFFDVTRIDEKTLFDAGNKLEIFLYLNQTSVDLERSVSAESFALGCAPMVNLFKQRAEPILLTETMSEYRVIPDSRRPQSTEVHSIDRVTASEAGGGSWTYLPFYSMKHGSKPDDGAAYWHATRRPAGPKDPATEVFLSLVDLGMEPSVVARRTVSVEITALNRDLPAKLPFGGGHPHLNLAESTSAVASIACLTPPTATLRPPIGRNGQWRLISHLALNHLSLVNEPDGVDALKEILRLYDFQDSPETRALIDSVLKVSSRRGSARAPSRDMGAFCRGVDVSVEFEGQRFTTSGLFLLACVLERFLALYCSINSFTRLTATVRGRPGVLRKWPPRAGETVLL